MEKFEKGFTHSGIFHADDVFSAALLTYLNPKIKIIRGFEPADFDGIVFDIGFGEFDHHQTDKRIRENGIPYAAFGLLWEKFGEEILEKEDAAEFDESFIQPLDYSDNTGEKNILAGIIASFNPEWDSIQNSDDAFDEAKLFALKILQKKFNHILSNKKADELLKKLIDASDNKKYIILPQFIPWKRLVCKTDLLFVVYPSNRGGFNVQAVPVDKDSNVLRCPFPESWRGKTKDEIYKISGIKGINFCHNSGFLVAAEDEETAVIVCETVISQKK